MRRLLTALFIVAAVSGFAGSASAQETSASAPSTTAAQPGKPLEAQPATPAAAPETPAVQQEILVGVYVLDIGKLDISTGSFTVDFYLDLKSRNPKDQITEDAAAIEFMNGRGTFDKMEDKGNEKFYRVLATLNTPIDLRRFPFDAQKMQIILENKTNSLGKVKYIPLTAESGMDQAIVFPGWDIKGWAATAGEHEYPVYKTPEGKNEIYSQYIYSVNIARIPVNSFLKTFLPVLFLMLIVAASFILDPDKVTARLGAISSALIASVMFHVSISGQIPPVGYLTFADKFMVLTYLILLMSFCLSLAVYIMQGKPGKQAQRAQAAPLHGGHGLRGIAAPLRRNLSVRAVTPPRSAARRIEFLSGLADHGLIALSSADAPEERIAARCRRPPPVGRTPGRAMAAGPGAGRIPARRPEQAARGAGVQPL